MAVCCLGYFSLASCSADVLKITLDDAIQPVTAEYIARALDTAADKITTKPSSSRSTLPEDWSIRRAKSSIKSSPRPCLSSSMSLRAGSRAGSAGFFILEAADVAAMAPGTNAGAAHPVTLFGKPDEDHDDRRWKTTPPP